MSELGAFMGMLLGFLGCVIPKSVSTFWGLSLPLYMDPFIIGVVMSLLGIMVGNKIRKADRNVSRQYEKLHVRPEAECIDVEDKKTHSLMYVYLCYGLFLGVFFVFAYAVPYMKAM